MNKQIVINECFDLVLLESVFPKETEKFSHFFQSFFCVNILSVDISAVNNCLFCCGLL